MSEKRQFQTLYDPKQVSEMLGLPASSLRRYAVDWSAYLSEYANRSGRKRRYTDQDILILKKVRELTSQRRGADEIAAQLSIVDNDNNQSALSLMPQIMSEFENVRARFAAQDDRLQDYETRIQQLEEKLKKRSLWERLFGKK